MTLTRTLPALAGAALLAGALGAQADTMAAMDADADGAVSFEEFQAVYPDVDPAVFEAMDTDASTVLTIEELEAGATAGLIVLPET